MRRRRILLGLGAMSSGIAGCIGDRPGTAPSPTGGSTPGATPTQATGLATIEYSVVNADDEPHELAVVMEAADGRVIQETFEPSLPPGGDVASGSAGHPPEDGPYTLRFESGTTAVTYTWDARECARIDLLVTFTTGGGLTVERTLCQN